MLQLKSLIGIPSYIILCILFLIGIYMVQHDFIYNESNYNTTAVISFIFVILYTITLFFYNKKKDIKIKLYPYLIYKKIINYIILIILLFTLIFFGLLVVIPRYATLITTPKTEIITEALLSYSSDDKECPYQLKLKYYPLQSFQYTCVSKDLYYNTPKPIYVRVEMRKGILGTLIENIYILSS